MTLTKQEELFMQRVALKRNTFPQLSISAAMQAVCQDDQRLFEQYITMPDRQRAELITLVSRSVYERMRREHPQS